MNQVNAYALYELGDFLGRLGTRINRGAHTPALRVLFAHVANALRHIEESFAPLPYSRDCRLEVAQAIAQLSENGKLTGEMDDLTRHALVTKLRRLRDLFESELRQAPVYYVPQRLGYDTAILLANAERLLPETAAKAMPHDALLDFQEAGRCLAFGRWTAVAFHVLRAAETVLVELIRRLGGTIPDEESRNWSTLTRALSATGKAKKRMRGPLDRLKDFERNELMHAGRFLDEAECSDVFDYAKNAMVPMLMHLAELAEAD